MADKRQKIKGRRSGPTFGVKPHHIFRADTKNNKPSPASVLSHMAAHMLDNLVAQYNGSNNGDLTATPKIMKLYGWTSHGSVSRAVLELLALGFIQETRLGGRNKCALYAVTWLAIDDCAGKLDVPPTSVPSNLWTHENKAKIEQRFVDAWNKHQMKPKPEKLKTVPAMRVNVPAMRVN